jgi:hypothetical protein
MDRPPPDPVKLLESWMEWERGETPPGRVMSNLKTGGLRDLLEALVAGRAPVERDGAGAVSPPPAASAGDAPTAETWTPVV